MAKESYLFSKHGIKMRIYFYLLLLLIPCIFIFSGCGKDIKTRLEGKWVIDDAPETLIMEFYRDGRVISTYKEGVELKGMWQVQTDDKIEITLEAWNIIAYFAGNKLILKSGESEKIYRKIE
jgi:hypothetical protein